MQKEYRTQLRATASSGSSSFSPIVDYLAAFHHPSNVLGHSRDIRERISIHGDDISVVAGRNGAEALLHAEHRRRIRRRRLQRLRGRHTERDELFELAR